MRLITGLKVRPYRAMDGGVGTEMIYRVNGRSAVSRVPWTLTEAEAARILRDLTIN